MPPELSIIVPVYNEERTLLTIIDALKQKLPAAQIIYVDDGSKDNSLSILKQHARPQDTVLTKENGGKGSAIRMGLAKAEGTYTVIQDADLEYEPSEISTLVEEAKRHPGDAVFGSRFLRNNPNIYKRFLIGNKVMTAIINLLFFAGISDSYTCYKLLPTSAFQSLTLNARGFELEAEICAQCVKKGIRIREVPISYHPRTIEEGKKINARDAWKGVKMMVRQRFSR